MKICPDCKTQCVDSDKFCTVCGAALQNAQPETAPANTREETSAPGTGYRAENRKASPLKALAASKLGCTIAIAFTLIVLLAIISCVAVPRTLAGFIDEAAGLLEEYDIGEVDLSDMGLSDEDLGMLGIATDGSGKIDLAGLVEESSGAIKSAIYNLGNVVSAVFSNLKGILVAASMWIIFISAKSAGEQVCSSAGFTILQVLRVLSLIGTCLLAVATAVIAVAVLSYCSQEAQDATGAAATAVSVIGVVLILKLLYHIGILRTLKRFKGEISGEDKGHVSGYAGVILVLKGIWKIVAALLAIVLVIIAGAAALPTLVSAAASAVACFGCSKFIFRAKKELA